MAISARQPGFWRRSQLARGLTLAIAFCAFQGVAGAQSPVSELQPGACDTIITRFHRLLDIYVEEGGKAIANGEEPARALEAARAQALKGDVKATLPLVGVTLLIYGRRDMFPVAIIRQVCNLAARNALPQHVVACAYFNALNPIGDKDEKRRAVGAEIARFEAGRASAPEELGGHIDALKACLPN